ncbi:MAG: DNA mismatch repair protein MutS, partial [Vicinamibacterales bacterium]
MDRQTDAAREPNPRAAYDRRLAFWRTQIAALERSHVRLSNGRLVVAAVFAALFWFAAIRASVSGWWPVFAAITFGALVVVHARVLHRIERARRAERSYLRGHDRLAGRWAGNGRGGDTFGGDHPYARDLDLFGPASLFELLNTARTEAGEATLAAWLKNGAPVDEVLARQAAVDELRGRIDFREDLEVLAAESHVSRTGALAHWAVSAPVGVSGGVAWIAGGFAAVTAALAVLAYLGPVSVPLFVGWLLTAAAIAFSWRRRLRVVMTRIGQPADDLALLAELVARIEREPLSAPRLQSVKDALSGGDGRVIASRAIARLTQLVSLYESTTHNTLFAPFTVALHIPDQLALAIDRWHAAHGHAVEDWLRVVGELEALSALATYAFEHPADPFPALDREGAIFHAEALGHPLMAGDVAVRNDVRLGGGAPRVIVISGSNMSGKSTLLRSVGVNVVLALAGGPVRAASLRLSPLALGATLRIEDSLQAGRSRFYAEILRIRGIVAAARGPAPLLFLLDEILHGTNSYDRRIGAEAIVRALMGLETIGLVTTHDLALTEMPARLGASAANMHFEDRLEHGVMVFDYLMRPGVVEHSNALAL